MSVYTELIERGFSDDAADKIAKVANKYEELITKDYLRAELGELRSEFHREITNQTKFIVAMLAAMTAIFSAIVKLL